MDIVNFPAILISSTRLYWGLFILLFVTSCATPVAPTGGQLDRSGPVLVATSPLNATTNFHSDEIRFTFEDYVDRNSFRNAFNIEPDINLEYDIKWRRKTAIIQFKNTLPDSTTLIFSIGNELRDTRSNKLNTPIKLAISTGDIIDQQKISFQILPFQPGISVTEPKVFLYREPFDLNSPAFYTGSADTSGYVNFNYLSDGIYKAILVHDINRDRIWDRDREFAQPFRSSSFNIDEIDTSEVQLFYYAKTDTVRPSILGVGLMDATRLRIRFSKDIKYTSNNFLEIESNTNQTFNAIHLYNDPRENTVGYYQVEEPLNESSTYQIHSGTLTDNVGNPLRLNELTFEGSSQSDTTSLLYIGSLNTADLLRTDTLKIRYSKLIDTPVLEDSVKIYVNRSDAKSQFQVDVFNNLLVINPIDGWSQSDSYEIKTWDPALASYRDLRPTIINDLDLGELSIQIKDSTFIDTPLRIRMFNQRNQIIINEWFQNEIVIKQIPNGAYHLSIFNDATHSGHWDYGQIEPYRQPTFIYIDKNFPISSRMTSELVLD